MVCQSGILYGDDNDNTLESASMGMQSKNSTVEIYPLPLFFKTHPLLSPGAMGKSDAEVIALFNEQVNMTADELEAWLNDPQSRKAGTGVGIESGRHLVEILRKNPGKDSDGYDEVRSERGDSRVQLNTKLPEQEDMAHIRKVVRYVLRRGGVGRYWARHRRFNYGHVSYNNRHLAQEDHLKVTKTTEELKNAKSTIRQVASASYLSF
jgi:Protein of unknown function (DUF3140)